MFPVDESRPGFAFLERHDLADDEGVIAGVVLGPDRALDPGERVGEEWGSRHTVSNGDVVPEHDRRRPARASLSCASGRRPVSLVPSRAPGIEAAAPTPRSFQSTPPGTCPTTPAAPTKKPTVTLVPIAAASGWPILSIAGRRSDPRISP